MERLSMATMMGQLTAAAGLEFPYLYTDNSFLPGLRQRRPLEGAINTMLIDAAGACFAGCTSNCAGGT
jgi:hypothetical protein